MSGETREGPYRKNVYDNKPGVVGPNGYAALCGTVDEAVTLAADLNAAHAAGAASAKGVVEAARDIHAAVLADQEASFCLRDHDEDWNLDHHQEITATVGDVRRLDKALAAYSAATAQATAVTSPSPSPEGHGQGSS